MRIELDYLRGLLIFIDNNAAEMKSTGIRDSDPVVYAKMRAHLEYMASKGWLHIKPADGDGPIPTKYYINEITAEGRDWLDKVRDPEEYERSKADPNSWLMNMLRPGAELAGIFAAGFANTAG